MSSMNADLFLTSLLGQYGKARRQGNIKPSARRIHDNSMWTPVAEKKKVEVVIDTHQSLADYFEAQGQPLVAQRHNEKIFSHGLRRGAPRKAMITFVRTVAKYLKMKQRVRLKSFLYRAFGMVKIEIKKSLSAIMA